MARPIGDIIPGILLRARRLAIIGELARTYGDPEDRKGLIMDLYEHGVITSESAELLIENLGLEAA